MKKQTKKNFSKVDQVAKIAENIIEAFESGSVPSALANMFLRRVGGEKPCDAWSWGNWLIAALFGGGDARGFKQWRTVGRSVLRGAKAIYILAPLTKNFSEMNEETGEEEKVQRVVGFRAVPVFGVHQTEGEPLIEGEKEFLSSLPLLKVAEAWGIKVKLFNGAGSGMAGSTDCETRISLGVQNLSTWAHELVHNADSRNVGGLKAGQHLDQEVVAELGGAILLECLGYESEADRGGAWSYIQRHAGDHKAALRACNALVSRTCDAVNLILETAGKEGGKTSQKQKDVAC